MRSLGGLTCPSLVAMRQRSVRGEGEQMLGGAIRRNRWATVSALITVGNAVVIYSVIRYLDSRGLWNLSPPPRVQSMVSVWGGLSVLASFAIALLAVGKDESKAFAAVALCLSLVSFFFYVQ